MAKIKPGQIVLFRFPNADMSEGKLRPALILAKLPGRFDDWLICMVSSQLHHMEPGFDQTINPQDSDFKASGLHTASLIRVGKLAVVESIIFVGPIGEIGQDRLKRLKLSLADWMLS